MTKYYVGLASTFHDSAIAILNDKGETLFAEATERRLQYKRALNCVPDNFDVKRIIKEYCEPDAEFIVGTSWSQDYLDYLNGLEEKGLFKDEVFKDPKRQEVSKYLFSEGSMLTVMRLQQNYMKKVGVGMLMAVQSAFGHSNVTFRKYPHHLSHAAYACYTSPYEEAACIVTDGFGEQGALSTYQYQKDQLIPVKLHKGSESLGWMYELITTLCGFDWFTGEEWKVMGLAPYGKHNEEIYQLIKGLCKYEDEELVYAPLETLKENLYRLQKLARTKESSPWEAADMAFCGQKVFSEIMMKILDNLNQQGISKNLVLGGGCALNSSFNGTVIEHSNFDHLYVPSAPADDGNAIGAAMLAFKEDQPNQTLGNKGFYTPYLGSSAVVKTLKRLEKFGQIKHMRHLPLGVYKEAAKLLADGKLIAWFQGRAEFGPRALGNRSILADPRPADMKDKINSKVKFREEFRPFAPSILHEFGEEYFEYYQETPYMERTLRFRDEVKEKVPAVVHANQTGRLQSVKKEWNARYYNLIKSFYNITGVPILLNTSLNVMGKPIVHSVEDVISLFYTTGIDAVVINDYIIEK